MSVPRPAMLVAIVTDPFSPAFAIISASRAWFLAFNTSCGICLLFNKLSINSFVSIAIVPTSTGCPALCLLSISSTRALNLPACVV